jgi:hypothetical protein
MDDVCKAVITALLIMAMGQTLLDTAGAVLDFLSAIIDHEGD